MSSTPTQPTALEDNCSFLCEEIKCLRCGAVKKRSHRDCRGYMYHGGFSYHTKEVCDKEIDQRLAEGESK